MEQKPEEIITNETSKSRENFDIVKNDIELERSSLRMQRVSDDYPMNHAGYMIRNYECGNEYMMAKDKGSLELSLKKDLWSHVAQGPNNYGINLREWLECKGVEASKNEKLCLFRKIVHIVDVAHSKRIGLMELQPSSFILSENGDVKYIGSQIECGMWNVKPDNRKRRCLNRIWLTPDNIQLEKKWYAFPEGEDLLSLNVYSLGLFLFEFLCYFESLEAHSAAMLDLHHRILPPSFLSENPRESGFCFWLLHPQPSSRPTTREILESELIYTKQSNDEASCVDMVDDAESDLLLHFLVTLKQQMQSKTSNLLQSIKFLDVDINMVESGLTCSKNLYQNSNVRDHKGVESSCSISDSPKDKYMLENINELEKVYLSMRSNTQLTESHVDRPDIDVLTNREELSLAQTPDNLTTTEETSEDRLGIFFDGICKFARYKKFEVCGTLKGNNILSSNNVICSLSFDREEEYIAATGLSKKIKIFEFTSLLDDYVDVQYPVLEISNKSELSSICWNKYIKNYLASADYDGLVKIWDSNTGQDIAQYNEHQKRAWSVDFSQVDPMKFATGGDDCFLKLWSINERNSICTIWNPASICCVQLSSYSSHLLALGSADYRIRCYDVRHTRIPWCTLSGHDNAVSYVRFLDSETIVSASTDCSLKRWDLKKTSLDGSSPNACTLTFNGHTNNKSFVGLAVMDGFIACGSETNEVYAYYKSLPMAMSRHKFGDENSDGDEHFVSSVRWRRKSQMLVAANSNGTINILRFASP